MRRDHELESTIVEKYAAVEAFLDERGRRVWAATESRANALSLHRSEFHGDWNYELRPR